MNSKMIALLVVILVIVVLGVAVCFNTPRDNDDNIQNQVSGSSEENNSNQPSGSSEENNSNQSNGSSEENNSNQPSGSSEENNSNQPNGSSEENNNPISNEEANLNTEEIEEEQNTDDSQGGKMLVVYFSQSGNTEAVANIIHEEVGGDIIKLETEEVYPSDYNTLLDVAQEEQRENARPTLSTKIENIDEYDTIFLGYPNWWADMPMSIYTFLDEYDLSGKTIAPFITHGGSGLSGTPGKIQAEEPNATVTAGLAVNGSSSRNSQNAVKSWLSEIGF